MSKAQAKGKKQQVESDESEEEEIIVKKQKGSNGKANVKVPTPKQAVQSDDSDEEEAPKPSKPSKIAEKVNAKASNGKASNGKANGKKPVESDDESEEEAPKVSAKATPKSAAKAPVKSSKKQVEDSDESEEEAPKASAKATPKSAAKVPAKNGKKQAEEEDSEEEVAPKVQVKTPVQAAKQDDGPYEIIVKGLAFSLSDHDIREYFQECGNIERVNLLKGPDGRSKGIAFLTFDSAAAVTTALSYTGSDFSGRPINVEKTTPKEQRAPTPAREFPKTERDPTSSSIFVGNLSYDTTEESLAAFFESCGKVTGARIAYGQDGNPRGFAHVDFASVDSVEKAVAKSGSKVDGRAIRVDYSSSKKNDGGNRGGNRGGFGGGFGSGGKKYGQRY